MTRAGADVASQIATLVASWRRRHGVFPGGIVHEPDRRRIVGWVVTAAQREAAERIAREHRLACAVRALADDREATLAWLQPTGPVVLRRQPGAEPFVTELEPRDGAVRVVARWQRARLVQAADGTLGWVDADASLQPCAPVAAWPPLTLPPRGAVVRVPAGTTARLVAHVTTWVGVPYVLGGRSRQRVDCSGLVSLVVRDVLGWTVPRHSTDQMRRGVRVARVGVRSGDLLFARLRDTGVSHVGFVLGEPDALHVGHASQRAGRVVVEPLETFLADYRFMAARRWLVEESADAAP